MMAHIAEHAGFKYRAQIEQQMGISLPPQDDELPPQVELALSTMIAQAAQQVRTFLVVDQSGQEPAGLGPPESRNH